MTLPKAQLVLLLGFMIMDAPHDVYAVLRRWSGEVLHSGETGRTLARVNECLRDTVLGIEVDFQRLATVRGKDAARTLETRHITLFTNIFERRPPFNSNKH